jgi:hypothetical protein
VARSVSEHQIQQVDIKSLTQSLSSHYVIMYQELDKISSARDGRMCRSRFARRRTHSMLALQRPKAARGLFHGVMLPISLDCSRRSNFARQS